MAVRWSWSWSWSWRSGAVPLVLSVLAAAVLGAAGPARAEAAAYWVAQAPGCSDGGAGTQAQPFCTIAKAARVAGPGATVEVSAGTYREKVTVTLGGAPGRPVTFRARDGVVVLGTVEASSRPWSPAAGGAFATPWNEAVAPRQVFVDGALLAPAGAPDAMAPGTWYHDTAGLVLYVRTADGASPAGHQVEVGRQTQGFQVTGRSDVVIDGFAFDGQNGSAVDLRDGARLAVRGATIRNTGSYGVSLANTTASSVTGTEVLGAASHGVLVRGGSQATVAGNRTHDNRFHGIALQGLVGSTIEANQSWANARPNVRSAAGISVDLDAATGQRSENLVLRGNVLHHNQDSGISTLGDTRGGRYENNLAYANGDHGFDTLKSPNNTFYANTSVGNHKDGFSVEGGSTGTRILGNVAVDNGTTTHEYNLFVDASSGPSLESDSNLFFNTDPAVPPVRWNGIAYPTVAAYAAASGQDTHSRSADPRFADRGAGDFHLRAGSPAIDAGTSAPSDYPATDQDGNARVDDDSAPNTGQGPVAWYDMGAFERLPPQLKVR
jgi:nitrous oxidase accessory protein NosD